MPYIDFTAEQLGTKRCVAETHESLVGDGLGRWYEKKAKPGVAFGNVCQACYQGKVKASRQAKAAPKFVLFAQDVKELVTQIRKDRQNAKKSPNGPAAQRVNGTLEAIAA